MTSLQASLAESSRPGRYDVFIDGEAVVKAGRDPEHEACRVLLARGVTGRITFIHRDGMAGLSMDIAKGAGWSTREATNTGRPRVVKFEAFTDRVASRTRAKGADGEICPGEANARQ